MVKAQNLLTAEECKIFGRLCCRCICCMLGKKYGKAMESSSLSEAEFFLGEMQKHEQDASATGPAPAPSSHSSPASKPASLEDSSNPLLIAQQHLKLEVGLFYSHKDKIGQRWLLSLTMKTH